MLFSLFYILPFRFWAKLQQQLPLILLGLCCLWLGISPIYGQLVVVPLEKHPTAARLTEEVDTVFTSLPFFDDFSRSTYRADSSRWQTGGGTYISNTLALDPPTFNVATFDGASIGGVPYNFEDSQAEGLADRLTSRFLDLSPFNASDSLLFSFFWQPEGLGQMPNQNDSLLLQFSYAQNGESDWETVWAMPGDSVQPFRRTEILINQSRFLHPNFRFRFQNYARLSGGYDTWHIDYIALYPARSLTPEALADVALGQAPTSLLKRYFSMPARQFLADPVAALVDTVSTRMNNLSNTFVLLRPNAQLTENYTNTTLGELNTVAIGQNGNRFEGNVLLRSQEKMDLLAAVDKQAISGLSLDSLLLSYTFFIDSAETAEVLPTRSNDTLTAITVLNDYYAYDDGSAEFGLGVAKQGGQVAVVFQANQPDVMTHVDIYFPKIGASAVGQTYNLTVWSSIDTADFRNSEVLHVQNVAFQYTDTVNQFQRIALERRVNVQDTFYIGYTQLADQMMVVGYDANTQGGQYIFYNIASKWQPNVEVPGSMMIRPVFEAPTEDEDIVLSNERSLEQFPFKVYPNPTSGFIQTNMPFQRATAFNLQGQQVQTWHFNQPSVTLNANGLKSGLYIFQFWGENGYYITKKISIEH